MKYFPPANYTKGFARNAAESSHPSLWQGLISSWAPAFGNTGVLVPDYSGHRNDGTQVGLAPASDWLVGECGHYLDFVGDGQYITIPQDVGGEVGSVVAWVKPNIGYNSGSPFTHSIYGIRSISGGFFTLRYDSGTSNRYYTFAYRFAFGSTVTLNGNQFSSDADFQIWTPIVCTWDNTNGSQELWVHGISENSGSTTTNAYPGNTTWAIADDNVSGQSWTGGIAAVHVYNRVLTDQEISALSKRPGIMHEKRPVVVQLFLGGASTQNLTASLFTNSNSFYAATVTPGSVTLTPSIYNDTDTFNTHTVSSVANLTASLFNDSDSFYSPTVAPGAVDLTPVLYSDADTFNTHTVTPGSVALSPSLYSDSDTFYTSTVSATYNVTPDIYTDADTFYAATVSPGSVDLTPSLYDDSDTFYSHSISLGGGTQELTPSLFVDSDTFYTHAVTGGTVTLQPSLYQDSDVFYTPTVSAGAVSLTANLFTNTNTLYSSSVSSDYALTASLFAESDTFYSPSVSPGAVVLSPSLFTDSDTFYTHVISGTIDIEVPASRIYSVEAENRVYSIEL